MLWPEARPMRDTSASSNIKNVSRITVVQANRSSLVFDRRVRIKNFPLAASGDTAFVRALITHLTCRD